MSVTSNSLFGHAGMATAEIGYPPGSNLEMSVGYSRPFGQNGTSW
jgi:hypothetical protein